MIELTTSSATALEDIIQEASLQADAVVAYFYFDFNDVQKQHTQPLYAA